MVDTTKNEYHFRILMIHYGQVNFEKDVATPQYSQ